MSHDRDIWGNAALTNEMLNLEKYSVIIEMPEFDTMSL